MITVQMLAKDNEQTILACLDSLRELDYKLLVGNLGSNDQTINICRAYKAKVLDIESVADYSEIRNRLTEQSSTKWQFFIEPYERLMSGSFNLGEKPAYKLEVLANGVSSFQTRIWKKDSIYKFKNPIFEALYPDDAPIIENVAIELLVGKKYKQDQILNNWELTDPVSPLPNYYSAYAALSRGDLDIFVKHAKLYLFKELSGETNKIIMKYYLAKVLLAKKDLSSFDLLLDCLASKPDMAEFWCILADFYFHIANRFDIAEQFYKNSIVAGRRRNKRDGWIFEESKYQEYPAGMIDKCVQALKIMKIK